MEIAKKHMENLKNHLGKHMPCGFAWFVIFRDKSIFWSFFEWVRVWFQVKTSVASHLKLLEIIQWRTADGCYVFWMLVIMEVVLSSHSTRTLKPAGIVFV